MKGRGAISAQLNPIPAEPVKRLLRETDIAARTDVSLALVRKWRLVGNGPKFIKLGSAVRYREEDLNEWLGNRPSGGGR